MENGKSHSQFQRDEPWFGSHKNHKLKVKL